MLTLHTVTAVSRAMPKGYESSEAKNKEKTMGYSLTMLSTYWAARTISVATPQETCHAGSVALTITALIKGLVQQRISTFTTAVQLL